MTCKFTKNVALPQVFSCILLVQFIYLVYPEVETLPELQAQNGRTTSSNPTRQITGQRQQ